MTTLGDKIISRMEALTHKLETGEAVYNNWEELAIAVNNWSMANFGSQSGVGALVPLLGIVEEIDELATAITLDDQEDAIGDILIFSLDYCKRSGMVLDDIPVRAKKPAGYPGHWIGRLAHARVKRLQGIRGMDNLETFREAEKEAITGLFSACDRWADSLALDGAFDIACKTWTNVVAKRKWHTQPDKPITFESSCEDFKNVAAELNWGIS